MTPKPSKHAAQDLRASAPVAGGRYRHYKGGEYVVLENAIHEATLEHLVVYGDAEGNVWARAIGDWSATVEVDGHCVARFTPLA